jgi:hypothetical protein
MTPPKHFEKILLGIAALAAVALGGWGWLGIGKADEEFAAGLRGSGKDSTAVEGADRVPRALQSLSQAREWKQATVTVNGAPRAIDLFTGIALFMKKDPREVVDPLDAGSAPIHPPITNQWWIDNHIDPGFADSPLRDPDKDGFPNREEFDAGSDPNDPRSYPSLIAKLRFLREERTAWVLVPKYPDKEKGTVPLRLEQVRNRRWVVVEQTPITEGIAPGNLFFDKRFQLLRMESREETRQSTGHKEMVTYAVIEDQKPNKKGKTYEIPAPLSENRKDRFVQFDRTAVLSLEALGRSGQEFKVEENTSFALPPDAPQKDFLVKEVSADAVTIELTNKSGARETVRILAGQQGPSGQAPPPN